MKQDENQLLQEVIRLFSDLEDATYGKERANGRYVIPNASNFYYNAKRLYEVTDELVANYHTDYLSQSDYEFICDSKRSLLLDLDVKKGKKGLNEQELTYLLAQYLSNLQSLFGKIILKAKDKQ